MSEKHTSTEVHCEPGLYEIRIKAHLDDRWTAWFEGLNIKLEDNGDTLLTGTMVDQAALHGILKKYAILAGHCSLLLTLNLVRQIYQMSKKLRQITRQERIIISFKKRRKK